MTEDGTRFGVALQDHVQVGPADPTLGDLDEHLSGARFGAWHVLDGHCPVTHVHGGLHHHGRHRINTKGRSSTVLCSSCPTWLFRQNLRHGRMVASDVAWTVRAWVVQRLGSPGEVLRLEERDEPAPGPGELRLRVRAAALGLPDVRLCRGSYPFRPAVPFVAGQEVCGIVDAVGEGVEVPLGQRMMAVTNFFDGRGGFADTTIARAESAFRVSATMDDVDAACFRIGYSTAL